MNHLSKFFASTLPEFFNSSKRAYFPVCLPPDYQADVGRPSFLLLIILYVLNKSHEAASEPFHGINEPFYVNKHPPLLSLNMCFHTKALRRTLVNMIQIPRCHGIFLESTTVDSVGESSDIL